MKWSFFLAFMAATCYIAGMYRNLPLIVLGILEMLLLLVMFIWPHYLKRVLTVGFLSEKLSAEKKTNSICRILVKNKGIMAAGRFQVRIRFGYRYGKKKYRVRMFGLAGGYGENQLSFEIYTPYCGLLELELERVRFYDYLSLFSVGKKQKEKMQLLVLPQEQPLSMVHDWPEWSKTMPFQEDWIRIDGNEQMEIRQLREYQQGDDTRRIHWKQSARMQQLWVKELERETDFGIDFFLELAGEAITVEGMDSFYQIMASILLELMQQVDWILVHWLETGAGGEKCVEIRDLVDYQNMFLQLYLVDIRIVQAEREKQLFLEWREKGQEAFRLNRDLEWYYNETLIAKFSV